MSEHENATETVAEVIDGCLVIRDCRSVVVRAKSEIRHHNAEFNFVSER